MRETEKGGKLHTMILNKIKRIQKAFLWHFLLRIHSFILSLLEIFEKNFLSQLLLALLHFERL